MGRRNTASKQPVKGRSHQASGQKSREKLTQRASVADLEEHLSRLKRECDEGLEQQAATAEVLNVISRSTFDLQSVLTTMVQSAGKLCQAESVQIYLSDGEFYRLAADSGFSPEYRKYMKEHPIKPGQGTLVGRTALGVVTVQIPDVLADPEYTYHEGRSLGGFRTMLGVPLVRDGNCIGVISLTRSEVHPFTDRQIELLKTFADQAVIAIENTRLLNELRQRTDDLTESLEQQTATSEVLRAISSSPGELELVFQAMLENATRICEAKIGILWAFEDGAYSAISMIGISPDYAEYLKRGPIRAGPTTGLGRLASTKQTIHIADTLAEQAYAERDPFRVATAELGGARSLLNVPMIKEGALIGAIGVYRQEVRPFTDKQVELVTNFAAQAVIAIENTRLLNELRESLQQQTATADILKVISSSPGNLEPVFDALLTNAIHVCEAKFGFMYRGGGTDMKLMAYKCDVPAYLELVQRTQHTPQTIVGRVADTKQIVKVTDIAATQRYADREPQVVAAVEIGGVHTMLGVPLLKESEVKGVILLYRQEVRPFTDKQIELIQSFAAQAVIAIENTRLLNELRESLQQQTATAEVLRVISSSPGELEPVFNAMLENAARICEAKFGVMYRYENDTFQPAAMLNAPSPYADFVWTRGRLLPQSGVALDRLLQTKQVIHTVDKTDEQVLTPSARLGGARSQVIVPMLKEDTLIGAIAIYRQEVRPFTDKQIALLSNFADQAVIAVENVRLLNELRESLQQQTATADVLKVISQSTFDLQTVLQTLVESAASLCDADKTIITRQKDGVFYRAEAHGFSREFLDYVRSIPITAERGTAFGRALLEGRAVHIPDVNADTEYTLIEGQKLGDYRSVLAVPMLREGVATGVLSLTRSEVRPFSEKQIELASTFADQAAIAIENVRLFESEQTRTRELAASLEDLRTTQDRLVQTQKLASLGQLTAGIAHEIKNPLNFVNNFSAVSVELIDELRQGLSGPLDDKLRAQICEIADMLQGNLDKVVQHGQRADAIVKNMLLHSREGSGEHRPVDINALVEESLNLAYHGARAEQQGFNITLERSLDPAAGEADLFPQDVTRALLNLISNGFYAAIRREAQADGADYEPILAASTRDLGDRVEIRIRDNGTGIPAEVKEQMFNPFFTTKPAGEGTGLGLSISHDIIVKQHGGSIEVDTQPGEYTEIKITLPRSGIFLTEPAVHA
jgi:GAF domain-containing protein